MIDYPEELAKIVRSWIDALEGKSPEEAVSVASTVLGNVLASIEDRETRASAASACVAFIEVATGIGIDELSGRVQIEVSTVESGPKGPLS